MLALAEDWSYSLTHYQAVEDLPLKRWYAYPWRRKFTVLANPVPKAAQLSYFQAATSFPPEDPGKSRFFLRKMAPLKGCLPFNQQPRPRPEERVLPSRGIQDKEIACRKDDGRWSFGQEMWTSFSLAPRRRYRDLIEHKILAVNGEHQTHALALVRGSRRPDLPLWTSARSGRVHSSYCLYPAARRLVLSERECFFPSTVRVLRLGEEFNESVRLTNPSLRASSSSDFANILRWQADRRKTHRNPTSISSEAGA